MKKIFFVFAMLFMTVISALAEESTGMFFTSTGTTYGDGHFTIEGTGFDDSGLFLHGGNTITIKARNGEKITRVECHIGYGAYGVGEYGRKITTPNHDDVDYDDYNFTINNVNATSLVISSDITGNDFSDYLQIDEITVYYELGNTENIDGISDEYVLTESFANGGAYLGDNVKVEGNANGLYIGDGKTVTISPNNDKDVRIFKVDLEFSNEFSGTINSLDGSTVEGSGTNWTISDIFSSSLEISSPNGSGQISNVTVYYVNMSEETNKTIATTTGENYYNVAENRIKVTATWSSGSYGLDIDQGESVTITSYNGVEISKVELRLSRNYGYDAIESNVGSVDGYDKNWTISDINSSSLTISHPGEGWVGDESNNNYYASIKRITVYYKEPIINSEMVVAANPGEGYYWTTFFSNACNYQAPEGTEVYKVNLNGTKVTMSKIEDGIVTRCQGVVLKSTTENITMTKTDEESSDDYYGNSLWGTSSRITNPDPGNVYGLGYKESAGVAFYKLKSTGTIGANKAYLKANSSAAANAFFTFDFDATATGVDSINAQENEENADIKIYDLQGRRVANPGKGIYIVNGKKVLMK
jgi:hypothetical protein